MNEQRKYKLFPQVIEKTVIKNGQTSFDDQTLENYDEVVGLSFMVDEIGAIPGSKFITPFSIGREELLCTNFPIIQLITTTDTPVLDRYFPCPEGLPAKGSIIEGIYQDGNQGALPSYTLILILILKKYLD